MISTRASAFIIKDNKLLFAKNKDSPYYLVGGGIERGETSKEALQREIFEETGLSLEVDKLAIIQERFGIIDNQKFHEIRFFYSVKNDAPINIAEGTFTDQGTDETLHWLPIDKLHDFNIVPKFLQSMKFDNMETIKHVVAREY
ncbi:MAG: NUDIX domain-containing protein [Defluviitaleaceae bacterium]|nr:NUDIX domain-containing protein [Defluviitaleaceae bacterium]